MRIFVAGAHGVGKTCLCWGFVNANPGWTYRSASELIQSELKIAAWSHNKRVDKLERNQVALLRALEKEPINRVDLLLSGHFVLLNKDANVTLVEESIFASLNFSGVIVIEAAPELVLRRLLVRGTSGFSIEMIKHLMEQERMHAQRVCSRLSLPLVVLDNPTPRQFGKTIDGIYRAGQQL